MVLVRIGDIVSFAPNIGVQVHRAALEVSGQEVLAAIRTAYAHIDDKPLQDACCGASGPLRDVGIVTYEQYLGLLDRIRIDEAGRCAKRVHTKRRRAEYDGRRSRLVLALIEAGIPHVCAEPGCGAMETLTVDHVVALSRGGTDDLSNLRFLCRTHNSRKRDR